ncbi:hypothetical protein UY3_12191 [Chelonia mydas]|uniref:Uncharacterized protein n=1 Tax=Chelonia mydas TaxID=8469 RepID=M7B0V4_CHEMY|nr:hypothetical protein UY3_12191 [Chelonia mydas]
MPRRCLGGDLERESKRERRRQPCHNRLRYPLRDEGQWQHLPRSRRHSLLEDERCCECLRAGTQPASLVGVECDSPGLCPEQHQKHSLDRDRYWAGCNCRDPSGSLPLERGADIGGAPGTSMDITFRAAWRASGVDGIPRGLFHRGQATPLNLSRRPGARWGSRTARHGPSLCPRLPSVPLRRESLPGPLGMPRGQGAVPTGRWHRRVTAY